MLDMSLSQAAWAAYNLYKEGANNKNPKAQTSHSTDARTMARL